MANKSASKIDYSGRTVDILLLKTILEPVTDRKVEPDISGIPMTVTGIEKLVQRFALLFLTQIGTVKNRESEGSEFVKLLGSGRIYNSESLKYAAEQANVDVSNQIMREDETLDTVDDEALAKSEITQLSIDRSTATVSVTVKIVTKSGDTYTYITPIATGV